MTTVEISCVWCGNPGHMPADHPLPAGHEHFDPALDDPDNAVMAWALHDFVDWQASDVVSPPRSPLDVALGSGPVVACTTLAHWWPSTAPPGAACLCGTRTQRAVGTP